MQLIIDKDKYTLPKELSIQQWQECLRWDFENPSHWPRLIQIVTGAPIEPLKLADRDLLELGIRIVLTLVNNRKECVIKPFTDLNFGQFVDLDIYISLGIDKNLDKICALLTESKLSAPEALWLCDRYIDWRGSIYRSYSNLFGIEDTGEGEATEATDPMHLARSWYRIIVDLAGKDLLKLDQVTNQPLLKTLNFMALQKEIAVQELMKQQKQQRQYDLQKHRK